MLGWTQFIKNTLNPFWPPFEVKASILGGSDETRRIKVSCFDWDADGSHDLIGVFFTSLSELGSGKAKLSWDLINEKKRAKKKGYKNSGVVHCTVEVSETHSSAPTNLLCVCCAWMCSGTCTICCSYIFDGDVCIYCAYAHIVPHVVFTLILYIMALVELK